MKPFYSGFTLVLSLLIGMTVFECYAQRGIGTNHPSKAAVLELKSASRGLLIPRVALQNLTSFAPITGENATDVDKVNGLLVFNTTTQNNLYPGLYYWSTANGQWHRVLVDSDYQSEEPWYVQGTTAKATQNTQAIYQSASVAIGKNTAIANTMLDVNGSVRFGDAVNASVGANSFAAGEKTTATAANAVAIGYKSEASALGAFAGGGFVGSGFLGQGVSDYPGGIASGESAFSFGYQTLASGTLNVAMGYQTQATGDYYAFAFGRETEAQKTGAVAMGRHTIAAGFYALSTGRDTKASGNYSAAFGRNTEASSAYEMAIGRYNAIIDGSRTTFNQNDPIFQVGNGDATLRHNALTILKNGNIGIGISGVGNQAKPQEMLDIGSGRLRIRELPSTSGSLSDSLVVVDNQGVLGVIQTADLRSPSPWFKQNNDAPATANTDSLYILGTVAIGKTDVLQVGQTQAMLDVAGAIRAGDPSTTASIGKNSFAIGHNVEASGVGAVALGYDSKAQGRGSFAGGGFISASGTYHQGPVVSGDGSFAFGPKNTVAANYAAAFGVENTVDENQAFAIGKLNTASGNSAVVMGRDNLVQGNYAFVGGRHNISEAAYEMVIGRYNALISSTSSSTGWNTDDPLFQVGNGSSDMTRHNALTILKNGWVGIGYVSPSNESNELLRVNGSITTASLNYPDYVFADYFHASSQATTDYQFMSLEEVKRYVQNYHHLPRIAAVSDLFQTADGNYEINMTQLAIRSLEKIEETYLYLFEQQEEITRLHRQVEVLTNQLSQMRHNVQQLRELVQEKTAEK